MRTSARYYKALVQDDARREADEARPCAGCGRRLEGAQVWRYRRERWHFACLPEEMQAKAREFFEGQAPAPPADPPKEVEWNPRWSGEGFERG